MHSRTLIGEEGVSAWPYSVGIFDKSTSFEDKDLGDGGVSHLELLSDFLVVSSHSIEKYTTALWWRAAWRFSSRAGGCWVEGAGGCWNGVRLPMKNPSSGLPKVLRTREAIEAQKKSDLQHPKKAKERKNMKAKSPSNRPLLTPCPPRHKNRIFTKENRLFFTVGTSGRFFVGFWRLLGRLEKEKEEENEDEKHEKWKNKKLF